MGNLKGDILGVQQMIKMCFYINMWQTYQLIIEENRGIFYIARENKRVISDFLTNLIQKQLQFYCFFVIYYNNYNFLKSD